LKKDLINKDNGNYTVLNPVLKEWLIHLWIEAWGQHHIKE
jgi:hypothetical protein